MRRCFGKVRLFGILTEIRCLWCRKQHCSADILEYRKKIVEEEQHGQDRADYGKRLIRQLSDELTKEYGNAFSKRNLDYYRKFYICFRDYEIVNACVHNLTWTHFRRVLAVASQESREWYIREASEQQWSTRELDRNISTQYYEMPDDFEIKSFLIGHKAEVTDMCLTEYNEAETMNMFKEEGREEARIEIVETMLKNGKTVEEIVSFCDLPEDFVRKVEKEMSVTV